MGIEEIEDGDLLLHCDKKVAIKVLSSNPALTRLSISGTHVVISRPLVNLKNILDKCKKISQKEYDAQVRRRYEISDDLGKEIADVIRGIL